MAFRDKVSPDVEVNAEQAMQQVKRRLNMLDERLDNMDSILTTLVEKVMHQPVTLEVSCPKCGQVIQVNITSNVRLKA